MLRCFVRIFTRILANPSSKLQKNQPFHFEVLEENEAHELKVHQEKVLSLLVLAI